MRWATIGPFLQHDEYDGDEWKECCADHEVLASVAPPTPPAKESTSDDEFGDFGDEDYDGYDDHDGSNDDDNR